MATTSGGWTTQRLPLRELVLDRRNPRLPDDMQRKSVSQEELALFIDLTYDPLQIALSIARHGYFESEPLIAIVEDGKTVVVEGNRRLTALMGLSDLSLRGKFAAQNAGWDDIPRDVGLPKDYPVVIVADRNSVIPLLGFRHISGIAPWEPWAQARFIANLVEQGQSLEQIADLVGRTVTEVRSMYRDHEILRQASTQFDIDTQRAEESFGVFSSAMSRTKLREYIEAPAPREVSPDYWPLPEESAQRVSRLLTYIFGDSNGEGRVVTDSRHLKDLADVLGDASGAAEQVLRDSGDLADAKQAIQETASQFRSYINAALRSLKAADALPIESVDPSSLRALRQCQTVIERLIRAGADSELTT